MNTSSVVLCQRKAVIVGLHLQMTSPTSGMRSMRTVKLNWFVLAPVIQCHKIYLWLSHSNLVDSRLAFHLIFSRSLSTINIRVECINKVPGTYSLSWWQKTWLMNNKFRKWQMFNTGLNNLLSMALIFFSPAQILLAFTFVVLKLLCSSAPSAAGRRKSTALFAYIYFHWWNCLSPRQG